MQEAVFVQSHRCFGNSLLTACAGRILQLKRRLEKLQMPGNMVDGQPSNCCWEEEDAGEVANVSLRPCKAGLGQS